MHVFNRILLLLLALITLAFGIISLAIVWEYPPERGQSR